MRPTSESATPRPSNADFWMGLALLAGLRLCVLLTLPAAGTISNWTDTQFYYRLAAWLDQGHWPFLDYWVEYPPVFPFLSVGVYWVSRAFGGSFPAYQVLLALVSLAFDLGTYAVLYRLGRRLGGETLGRRAAWAWALLGYPLYVWRYSFDGWGVFFLLWGIERAITGRWRWAGAAFAVGALIKFFPILGVIALWREARARVGATAAAGMVGALALAPLAVFSPHYLLASLTSLATRSSWETVWALADGYFDSGNLPGPLEARLDPSLAGLVAHPSVLPPWLPLLVLLLALGGAWLAVPRGIDAPRRILGQTALLILAFLLANRGWSPQFVVWVLPFTLLCFAPRKATCYCLALTAVTLLEWPLGFAVGPELIALAVVARTGLLALLVVDLASEIRRLSQERGNGRLCPEPRPETAAGPQR